MKTPEPQSPVERCYEMRLTSHHHGDDNAILEMDFDLRREGEDWEPYALSVHNSSFLNYLQCAFTCQLAYLRMNATERGLQLDRVRGLCECDTEDWVLKRFVVAFTLELRHGQATNDDLAHLRERCLACPVSKNLPHVQDKDTAVTVAIA